MEIYDRIKARRKEIGLSAEDLASALGVSRATIYRYESAEIEKLPTATLVPLAKALKCSIPYLMGIEDSLPEIELTDLEKEIVIAFRRLTCVEKEMVLRSLGIGENLS